MISPETKHAMKTNRPRLIPDPDKSLCQLYAILLDDSVLKDAKFLAENPNYKAGMPNYYIGATSGDLAKRYRQHRDGRWNSSRIAREYGLKLCVGVVLDRKPAPRSRAYAQERACARRLRALGCGVYQK